MLQGNLRYNFFMCYKKPGPRCSAHAKAALTDAYKTNDPVRMQKALHDYLHSPAGIEETQKTDPAYAETLKRERQEMINDLMQQQVDKNPDARDLHERLLDGDRVQTVNRTKYLYRNSQGTQIVTENKEEAEAYAQGTWTETHTEHYLRVVGPKEKDNGEVKAFSLHSHNGRLTFSPDDKMTLTQARQLLRRERDYGLVVENEHYVTKTSHEAAIPRSPGFTRQSVGETIVGREDMVNHVQSGDIRLGEYVNLQLNGYYGQEFKVTGSLQKDGDSDRIYVLDNKGTEYEIYSSMNNNYTPPVFTGFKYVNAKDTLSQ